MEAKKNPSKDLSLQRNKFFLIGLFISISLAITAFEWRTVKVKKIVLDPVPAETETLSLVRITTIDPPAAPEPLKKMEPKKETPIEIREIIAMTNNTPEDNHTPIDLDRDPTSSISSGILDPLPEEDSTAFFVFVEKNPEPINGYKSFYDQLAKNMKYPRQASRMGIEGKVFVEFIVNKNGEPSDLKVTRGIGAGCDEEATRVLSLMKWKPGEQRGKPVRVKMSMSVNFKLN
jgi:periplasmic protein TonB